VHEDGSSAATTIYVAIAVLSCLRTALYPFLPRSSQRLSDLLGFDGEVEKMVGSYIYLNPASSSSRLRYSLPSLMNA